jgi:hypothetical protein
MDCFVPRNDGAVSPWIASCLAMTEQSDFAMADQSCLGMTGQTCLAMPPQFLNTTCFTDH